MGHKVSNLGLTWSFLVLIILTRQADAYWTGQDLTEAEWKAWPQSCKIGFLAAGWDHGPFEGRISKYQLEEFAKVNKIPGIHHFCIGRVAMNRSISKLPDEAKKLMKTAASEMNYSYSRIDAKNPKFSFVSAYYGKAIYGTGNRPKAFDIWRTAIREQPTAYESYIQMSQTLISEKLFDEALNVILEFDRVKKQPLPYVEYLLGYLYYKMEKYDDALKHLEQAKKLGYRKDTLRKKVLKLKASGKQ